MSKRSNTVTISKADKQRLDAVSRRLFNTTDLPYGVVLKTLMDDFERGESHD